MDFVEKKNMFHDLRILVYGVYVEANSNCCFRSTSMLTDICILFIDERHFYARLVNGR